jgi:hypothetical protein
LGENENVLLNPIFCFIAFVFGCFLIDLYKLDSKMTIASAQNEIILEISQIQDLETLETLNYYLKNRIMPYNLTENQLSILMESDAQYLRNEVKENTILINELEKLLEKSSLDKKC